MSGEDDEDEALTWAGARDPSYYESPEPKAPKPPRSRKSRLPSNPQAPTVARGVAADVGGGATPGSGESSRDVVEEDEEEDAPPSTSAFVLVCLGILGGLYALYTIGWFVSWQHLSYAPSDALELVAFQVQQVLAILAPPVWFVVVMLLTRERKPVVRLLWLVVGALALIPWSWILER